MHRMICCNKTGNKLKFSSFVSCGLRPTNICDCSIGFLDALTDNTQSGIHTRKTFSVLFLSYCCLSDCNHSPHKLTFCVQFSVKARPHSFGLLGQIYYFLLSVFDLLVHRLKVLVQLQASSSGCWAIAVAVGCRF